MTEEAKRCQQFRESVYAKAAKGDLTFLRNLRVAAVKKPAWVWQCMTSPVSPNPPLLHMVAAAYGTGPFSQLTSYRPVLDQILILADFVKPFGSKLLLELEDTKQGTCGLAENIICPKFANRPSKQETLNKLRAERFRQFNGANDPEGARFWTEAFGKEALRVPSKIFASKLIRYVHKRFKKKWNVLPVRRALQFVLEHAVEIVTKSPSDDAGVGTKWEGQITFHTRIENCNGPELNDNTSYYEFRMTGGKNLLAVKESQNEEKTEYRLNVDLIAHKKKARIPASTKSSWFLRNDQVIHGVNVYFASGDSDEVVGLELVSTHIDPAKVGEESISPPIGAKSSHVRHLVAPHGYRIQRLLLYMEEGRGELPKVKFVVGKCRLSVEECFFIGRYGSMPLVADFNKPKLRDFARSIHNDNTTKIPFGSTLETDEMNINVVKTSDVCVKAYVQKLKSPCYDSVLIDVDLESALGTDEETKLSILSFLHSEEVQEKLFKELKRVEEGANKDPLVLKELVPGGEFVEYWFDLSSKKAGLQVRRTTLYTKEEKKSYLACCGEGKTYHISSAKGDLQVMKISFEEQKIIALNLHDKSTVEVWVDEISISKTRTETHYTKDFNLTFCDDADEDQESGGQDLIRAFCGMISVGHFAFLLRVFGPLESLLDNLCMSFIGLDGKILPTFITNSDRRAVPVDLTRNDLSKAMTLYDYYRLFPKSTHTFNTRIGVMTYRYPYRDEYGFKIGKLEAWSGQPFDELQVFLNGGGKASISIVPNVLPGCFPPSKDQLDIVRKPHTFSTLTGEGRGEAMGTIFHAVQDLQQELDEKLDLKYNGQVQIVPFYGSCWVDDKDGGTKKKRGRSSPSLYTRTDTYTETNRTDDRKQISRPLSRFHEYLPAKDRIRARTYNLALGMILYKTPSLPITCSKLSHGPIKERENRYEGWTKLTLKKGSKGELYVATVF